MPWRREFRRGAMRQRRREFVPDMPRNGVAWIEHHVELACARAEK